MLPVADAKIRYIYREIRLYIFYMWLYIMSLKNLMFHWYCLEGKCASFISPLYCLYLIYNNAGGAGNPK